jgi:hypothetical protein
MVIVSLFADELELDHSDSFGVGETLLLLVGAFLLVAAVMGRRFFRLYRDGAVILVNTVILLVLVELGIRAVSTLGGLSVAQGLVVDEETAHHLDLPAYRDQPRAEVFWQEALEVRRRHYRPYVVWRRAAYKGETIEIDERGFRHTPGSDCREESLVVFALGGSTIWGWGAPDDSTIPSFLQQGLVRKQARPVCVVNLGEGGFVSTQEVVQLLLELQRGVRPDLVVFYDGVNDVIAAFQSGQAGDHQNLPSIEARFEDRGLLDFASRKLELFRLIRPARSVLGLESRSPLSAEEISDLAGSVVETYLENYDVVMRLAGTYQFEARHFWQPHLLLGDKPLSPEEERMIEALERALESDETLVNLLRETNRQISGHFAERERLHDLRDVFDTEERQIWIDALGHVAPLGNELVAGRILDILTEDVVGRADDVSDR